MNFILPGRPENCRLHSTVRTFGYIVAMGKQKNVRNLKIYLADFVAVSLLFVPISDRTQRIAAAAAALAAATAAAAEAGASRPGTYPEAE